MGKKKAREAVTTALRGGAADAGVPASKRAGKRKVSLTMDESLLDEIRAMAGDRPLSAVVNDLLAQALPQHRLSKLVDDMIAEAGEPPPEAYEHILSQWFGDEDE